MNRNLIFELYFKPKGIRFSIFKKIPDAGTSITSYIQLKVLNIFASLTFAVMEWWMLMMESAQFPDVQCYLLSYTNTRIEQPLEAFHFHMKIFMR